MAAAWHETLMRLAAPEAQSVTSVLLSAGHNGFPFHFASTNGYIRIHWAPRKKNGNMNLAT